MAKAFPNATVHGLDPDITARLDIAGPVSWCPAHLAKGPPPCNGLAAEAVAARRSGCQ